MFGSKTIQIPSEFQIGASAGGKYTISFQEQNGIHLNKDAPNSFNIKSSDESIVSISSPATGKLGAATKIDIQLNGHKTSSTPVTVTIDCRLYVCSDKGMCSMKNESLVLNVVVVDSEATTGTHKHILTME